MGQLWPLSARTFLSTDISMAAAADLTISVPLEFCKLFGAEFGLALSHCLDSHTEQRVDG